MGFEMTDMRSRSLSNSTWVPLRAEGKVKEEGQFGYEGYCEEYFGAVGIMLPSDKKEESLEIEWMNAQRSFGNNSWIDGDVYWQSDSFIDYKTDNIGQYPVLEQRFETGDITLWHLHQDMVLALGLLREGDSWVCPDEDYVEVARLNRKPDKTPLRLEIRAEHLCDYLNATNQGLVVCTFMSRRKITADHPNIKWVGNNAKATVPNGYWEGYVREIHEGGHPYGEKIDIFHVSRTDVDESHDVPVLDFPTEGETCSRNFVIEDHGRKLYLATGEMWRNEWIDPATRSIRIRKDEPESSIPFKVDNPGTTLIAKELKDSRRWLWFKPDVVGSLLGRRKGTLQWYTQYTGMLGALPNRSVHFGVNKLGLINVFAKDIANLPESHQKLWVAHNVSPDGGVSDELLASQMRCESADTVAAETMFQKKIQDATAAFKQRFGVALFREHPLQIDLVNRIHRFRALDREGLYSLAKDITRLITDSIDIDMLKKLRPKEEKSLGCLKRLEHLITDADINGRALVGPLVGAYNLRHADAHLPSTDNSEAMKLLGLNESDSFLLMGEKMIARIAVCLWDIADIFPRIPEQPV